MRIKFILLLSSLLLISCYNNQTKDKIKVYSGYTQGSTFTVKYYSGNDETDINNGIDSILSLIDYTASLYNRNSIISRVNNNDSSVELNYHFIQMFKISQETAELTNGAFDITVGPLVAQWGFGFKNNYQKNDYRLIIDKKEIDSLLQFVGYKNVDIINDKFFKTNKNIKIDFNGIAQGYTVDVISDYLLSMQIQNFLVEVGGELKTSGLKSDNTLWIAGIEKPADSAEAKQIVQYKIPLSNKALVTSGNYRKYIEVNGVKYSHTIDPTSGYPVSHSLLSVSVISDNCAKADALATAFMVMGLDKSLDFIKQNNNFCEAYFIYTNEQGNFKTYATNSIKKLIQELK